MKIGADSILHDAKQLALSEHTSLTAVIEEALIARLYGKKGGESPAVVLPTFKGSGLQAGVDLNDSRLLQDLMDGLQ